MKPGCSRENAETFDHDRNWLEGHDEPLKWMLLAIYDFSDWQFVGLAAVNSRGAPRRLLVQESQGDCPRGQLASLSVAGKSFPRVKTADFALEVDVESSVHFAAERPLFMGQSRLVPRV